MTDHEKKLNKVDLNAYKNQEGVVYGTIPGIHHNQTVASVPTHHTMAPQMQVNGPAAGKLSVNYNKLTESPIRDHNATYMKKQYERDLKMQADPA
jgi:hypothetical protein